MNRQPRLPLKNFQLHNGSPHRKLWCRIWYYWFYRGNSKLPFCMKSFSFVLLSRKVSPRIISTEDQVSVDISAFIQKWYSLLLFFWLMRKNCLTKQPKLERNKWMERRMHWYSFTKSSHWSPASPYLLSFSWRQIQNVETQESMQFRTKLPAHYRFNWHSYNSAISYISPGWSLQLIYTIIVRTWQNWQATIRFQQRGKKLCPIQSWNGKCLLLCKNYHAYLL